MGCTRNSSTSPMVLFLSGFPTNRGSYCRKKKPTENLSLKPPDAREHQKYGRCKSSILLLTSGFELPESPVLLSGLPLEALPHPPQHLGPHRAGRDLNGFSAEVRVDGPRRAWLVPFGARILRRVRSPLGSSRTWAIGLTNTRFCSVRFAEWSVMFPILRGE